MSVIKQIRKESKGMLLDGIGASEHIDSSGEILDIKGCDIQDVKDGVATINYEHKDDTPTDTIGRLVYAKKIFSADDCDDERQLMYWKKSGVPYIYIIGELMDDDGHTGAKDAAAIVRHYHSRGLPIVARWSIEGSTLDKDKASQRLKRSIFKRIALTLKPCNKDATSGVLFDPFSPKERIKEPSSLKTIVDKVDKFEHPSYTKLGGSMEVECMPWIDDIVKAELTKEEELREKFKAAYKAWDGEGDFKKFIKTQMPEISDEFVTKFGDMVDNFSMKVKKFEQLELTIMKLTKAVEDTVNPGSAHSVEFGGKKVKPGSALLYHGAGRTDMSLIGHDPDEQTFFAVPREKLTGWTDADLKKFPVDHEGLKIMQYPEELNTSPVIDAGVHGINLSPEAQKLVHGMELDPKKAKSKKHLGTNTQAYWTTNPAGQTVFVKPDVANERFGDSAREVAYYNTAKDFFGLGHYLPTTAAVRHPQTGQIHTITEAVPGEHTEVQAWTNKIPSKQEHVNTLSKLGDAGELDKLGLMDTILHNTDRHHQNYLYTPEGGIKLLDHGQAFGEGPHETMDNEPDYLEKYDAIKKLQSHGAQEDAPIHPATAQWLASLNPIQLKRTLRKSGVPLAHAAESVRRLQAIQQEVAANPQTKKFDLYNSPWGVRKAPPVPAPAPEVK